MKILIIKTGALGDVLRTSFLAQALKDKYKKINPEIEEQEEQVEKLISDILNIVNIVKEKGKKVSKAFVYILPKELENYAGSLNEIQKRTNLQIKIFAVNDKNKHDPENKAQKAKPGKPAIYLE